MPLKLIQNLVIINHIQSAWYAASVVIRELTLIQQHTQIEVPGKKNVIEKQGFACNGLLEQI